jgi:hypothetical protein
VGAAAGVALAAATILLAFGRGACALAESAAGVCPVEIDKAEIDSLVAQGFLNPGGGRTMPRSARPSPRNCGCSDSTTMADRQRSLA